MAVLISSCASYKKYTYPSNDPLTTKLHSLNIIHTHKDWRKDNDLFYKVFENELIHNIIETDSSPIGILEITQTNNNLEKIGGWGYMILGSLSCMTLPLLGVPIGTLTYSPEYDFVIYDIKGDIVANYTFSDTEKMTIGLYRNGNKKRINTHRNIINQFKKLLQRDVVVINHKLESAIQTATEKDIQDFKKKIIQLRKENAHYRTENSSYNQDFHTTTNFTQNQQQIQQGRSSQQIMADIKKHEGYKKDYERYLNEENMKSGSSYSPMRANMWNRRIIEVNNKLEELQNELRKATH